MKTVAYSSLCCKYIDDILLLVSSNNFGSVEWDLNFIPPILSQKRFDYIRNYIVDNKIELRFHLPYSYIEIAHNEKEFQTYSISVIKEYLKFIAKLGSHYAIIHVGCYEGSNSSIALKNLELLANYSNDLGIKLCMENLINGLTANTNFLKQALGIKNLFFCFDTGHCYVVSKHNLQYLSTIKDNLYKCVHSHVYKTEDNLHNHIPFNSNSEIKSSKIIKMLLESNCNWFTMELDSKHKQFNQKCLFEKFL